jgi:hypothetical protein
MKKITLLVVAILILSGPLLSKAYSGEIELLTSDIECSEDDKIVVHYSLKSTYDFEYPNVTLGFKVVEDGKTIACKEIKVVVPKDADGSEMKELVIDVPCDGKNLTLQSAVFYYIKRYKIDEWFADCK